MRNDKSLLATITDLEFNALDVKKIIRIASKVNSTFSDAMTIADRILINTIPRAKEMLTQYINRIVAGIKNMVALILKHKAIVEMKELILKEKLRTIKKLAEISEDEGHYDFEIPPIEEMLKVLDAAEKALDSAYQAAVQAILALKIFNLPEQSLNLLMTPKSFLKVSPVKVVNQVPRKTGETVAYNGELLDPLLNAIYKAVDIPEPAFVLPPEVFRPMVDIYFTLIDKVTKIINLIKPFLKFIEEPLPSYNDLRLTNPNFLYWSTLKFGPFGQKFFGMPV